MVKYTTTEVELLALGLQYSGRSSIKKCCQRPQSGRILVWIAYVGGGPNGRWWTVQQKKRNECLVHNIAPCTINMYTRSCRWCLGHYQCLSSQTYMHSHMHLTLYAHTPPRYAWSSCYWHSCRHHTCFGPCGTQSGLLDDMEERWQLEEGGSLRML